MGTDGIDQDQPRYVSYLLRLWQTQHAGALVWRASLQSADTGERQGFASLAELTAFLEQETAPLDDERPRPPTGENVDA